MEFGNTNSSAHAAEQGCAGLGRGMRQFGTRGLHMLLKWRGACRTPQTAAEMDPHAIDPAPICETIHTLLKIVA